MTDRPRLRVVNGDGPDDTGEIAVVIEDLEIAHGHIVEARAEARECPGDQLELSDLDAALVVADAAVTKALQHAHKAKP